MTTPADKTAKRISIEDWFVRYDAADLLKAFFKRKRAL